MKKFRNSRNIWEKRKITSIVENIAKHGYKNGDIYASFGEDSAAIKPDPNSKDLILLTTDAILPDFVQNSPYGAGFSAIYVGIDDILACGGKPLACSTIVAYPDDNIGKEIFRGILDATHVFKIPLIRGHTITDASNIALSSTIIGKSTTTEFLSAGGAKVGNHLIIVWDQDGRPAIANPNYWNTILMKNSEEFYKKREFLKNGIKLGYLSACKDISNGGILGTLYQMLEFAQKGAKLNLDLIEDLLNEDKFPYTLDEFLFLFLTSGFLISVDPKYVPKIQDLVHKSEMAFYPLGIITDDKKIEIRYQNETEIILEIPESSD